MFARALRLVCPLCGGGRLFSGWFAMNERCSACGFKFERETGYFLGSIYVNYGVAVAIAIVLHLLMQNVWHRTALEQVLVIGGIVGAFGLGFFRHARALWLAFDLSFDPPRSEEFERR